MVDREFNYILNPRHRDFGRLRIGRIASASSLFFDSFVFNDSSRCGVVSPHRDSSIFPAQRERRNTIRFASSWRESPSKFSTT